MQTVIAVAAVALAVVGVVGCVVPLLPGLVIAFAGVLLLLCGNASPAAVTLVWRA